MSTNKNCPEGFVLINAGRFTMGSPSSELYRYDDEDQHGVLITRDFYLQATPVTQGQWRRVMGTNPSPFTSCGNVYPVERVNWYEALAYLNALSESEGLEPYYCLTGCRGVLGYNYECDEVKTKGLECEGYRLPTEAEWEYAARAGTETAYYSGENRAAWSGSDPNLERIGWYYGNSKNRSHPVACKEPNSWGLYDMLGNVCDWVWDWYGEYPSCSVTDPEGPETGKYRVFRGGGWCNGAQYVRSATRLRHDPAARSIFLGLRPARTVKSS
jgi:formylglycine-generating enzyme required for sulfatase activity